MKVWVICTSINFYPRSPCGERPINNTEIDKLNDFYPRSPCGERLSVLLMVLYHP